jgi:hypothetical protein
LQNGKSKALPEAFSLFVERRATGDERPELPPEEAMN